MKQIRKSVSEILRENAKSEGVFPEFDKPIIDRLRDQLFSFIYKVDTGGYKRARMVASVGEASIGAIGAVLGFYTTFTRLQSSTALAVWGIYAVLSLAVLVIARIVPDDLEKFTLEIKRIQLVNLCERLASKLALFDLLPDYETDDEELIKEVSLYVEDLQELGSASLEKIGRCLNSNIRVVDSRETNIDIARLSIDEDTRANLHDITRQIVVLAGSMFGAKDFSAKLYLRVKKQYQGALVEILVSFSRHPLKGLNGYGTSWIKARGNPSLVWECLEKADHVIGDTSGRSDTDYDSVLAICLPGRVGVLAITSPETSAFNDKVDKSTVKALALSARHLLLGALRGTKS